MPNGEAERSLDVDAAIDEEVATPPSQARSVKPKAPKKRTAKRAATKTIATGPFHKTTPAKRSKRQAGGSVRVRLGNNEMFVSPKMADALTDKDLKRLRAVFKRALKRAQKGNKKKR